MSDDDPQEQPSELEDILAAIELISSLTEADSHRLLLSYYEQCRINRRRWH